MERFNPSIRSNGAVIIVESVFCTRSLHMCVYVRMSCYLYGFRISQAYLNGMEMPIPMSMELIQFDNKTMNKLKKWPDIVIFFRLTRMVEMVMLVPYATLNHQRKLLLCGTMEQLPIIDALVHTIYEYWTLRQPGKFQYQ